MAQQRTGLIQETRTDKNGVPVRRWVRAETRASATAIPAPAAPSPVGTMARLRTVEARLAADGVPSLWNGQNGWQLGEQERFRFHLSRFAPETIDEIGAMLDRETNTEAAHGIVGMTLGSAYQQPDEARVRAYAAFAAPLREGEEDFPTMEAAVRGLHQYDPDVLPAMKDYTQADERTRAACSALVMVAERLYMSSAKGIHNAVWAVRSPLDGDWDDEDSDDLSEVDGEAPMPVIGDRELAALVVAHPEKAREIVSAIEERGYENAAITGQIVLGPTPSALAGGIL